MDMENRDASRTPDRMPDEGENFRHEAGRASGENHDRNDKPRRRESPGFALTNQPL